MSHDQAPRPACQRHACCLPDAGASQAPWALTLEVPSWTAYSSAGDPASTALPASAMQNITLGASSDALAPASLDSQNITLGVTALFQARAAPNTP